MTKATLGSKCLVIDCQNHFSLDVSGLDWKTSDICYGIAIKSAGWLWVGNDRGADFYLCPYHAKKEQSYRQGYEDGYDTALEKCFKGDII